MSSALVAWNQGQVRPARLYAPLAPSGPPATRPRILGKASLAVCCMRAMADFLHACGSSWVHAVWREKIRVLLMDPSCMSSVTNPARSLLYEQSACARCYSHGISIFFVTHDTCMATWHLVVSSGCCFVLATPRIDSDAQELLWLHPMALSCGRAPINRITPHHFKSETY